MAKLAKHLKVGDRLGRVGDEADSNLVVSKIRTRKAGVDRETNTPVFEVVVWCKGLHHPMYFELDEEVELE